MEAQNEGRGVVGSTSNILNFIKAKTAEAVQNQSGEKLSFVLGTEAGMITAIVRGVQETLNAQPGGVKPEVEIIFPCRRMLSLRKVRSWCLVSPAARDARLLVAAPPARS